jgi:hypothetical protein
MVDALDILFPVRQEFSVREIVTRHNPSRFGGYARSAAAPRRGGQLTPRQPQMRLGEQVFEMQA